MTSFTLNTSLEGASLPVTDLALSAVRLMKDANYPWLLMMPRKDDLIEIIDLAEEDQIQLMREIALVSKALQAATDCDKLNVAALGNQVSQLHIHVIARRRDDPAWPDPVWGAVPRLDYPPGEAEVLIDQLRGAIAP